MGEVPGPLTGRAGWRYWRLGLVKHINPCTCFAGWLESAAILSVSDGSTEIRRMRDRRSPYASTGFHAVPNSLTADTSLRRQVPELLALSDEFDAGKAAVLGRCA